MSSLEAAETQHRPIVVSTIAQSKDGTAFTKAYASLTDACNSCHQALNHGVVDIGVPNRTSASDLNADSTSRN
jgi:hypothetical protein